MLQRQGLSPLNFGDTPLNDQQYLSGRGNVSPFGEVKSQKSKVKSQAIRLVIRPELLSEPQCRDALFEASLQRTRIPPKILNRTVLERQGGKVNSVESQQMHQFQTKNRLMQVWARE